MAPQKIRGHPEDSRLDFLGAKDKNLLPSLQPTIIKGRRNATSNTQNGSSLKAVTTLATTPEDAIGEQAGSEGTTGV